MSGLINKLIEINDFADFSDIVPVSALKHDNLAEVKNVLIEHTPEGPQMYPAEQISEERPEDTIAELVRGAFLEDPGRRAAAFAGRGGGFHRLSGRQRERSRAYDGKAQVIVSIYVERDSQKPIIIGKGAANLSCVSRRSCARRSTASSARKPSSTCTSRLPRAGSRILNSSRS